VADPRFERLFDQIRTSRFADLKGARLSASIPIPERLLNEVLAASIPPSAPVRDVAVQLQAGNRFKVRLKLARAEFLPPISLTFEIERQPALPDGPLVLRMLSMPGLVSLAGSAFSISSVLPPGVRLEKHWVLLDVKILLDRHGYGDLMAYLETLTVAADEGRLLLDVRLRVG
jgi:hypothetical protein